VYINSFEQIFKVNTSGIITVAAGSGSGGSASGDGGPAVSAVLIDANGIAIDGADNLYIVQGAGFGSVRMVNSYGIINTIAGVGGTAFGGDGGPATAAVFNNPFGTGTDVAGNVYIADLANARIRKINTSGIINTMAGTTGAGFSGDGSPATAAQLDYPFAVAADVAGDIYISDVANQRIRMVNASGIITTIAGNGSVGYSGDNCAATAASLNLVRAVAVDAQGNVYFADESNYCIRKISHDHAPHFSGGHTQAMGICAGTTDSINYLLTVNDTDGGQEEDWGMVASPAHGTLGATYTTTSTGGILTPAGLYYTPSAGYTGTDSFKMQVTDCVDVSDTTTVYVTVFSSPTATNIAGATNLCSGTTISLGDTVAGGVWSSASPGIATVGAATGAVVGIAGGTATISYSLSLSCGSAVITKVITVNPSPSIITGTAAVCPGLTTSLNDSLIGGTWSSGSANATIVAGSASATVTSGVVTGAVAGIATISYTMPTGCRTTRQVTVNPLPSVITGTTNVCAGLTTVLTDSATGGVWSSSNTNSSASSLSGLVTGLSAGNSVITYTLPTGCIKTTTVTINPLPSVIAGSVNVCVGNTITLNDSTSGGAWSATNTTAAIGAGSAGLTVTSDIVTGVAAGNDTIRYTLPTGCMMAKAITVNPLPAAVSGILKVCVGTTTSLTDASAGGAWSGGSTTLTMTSSTSSPFGVATGISTGTALVTYTLPTGCLITAPVTVNPIPSLITGLGRVCVGQSITLTDSVAGGAWTTSNGAIGSIAGGSSGLTTTSTLTGVYTGTVSIAYTLPSGCRATKTITVNPIPASIASATGAYNVCPGASLPLTDFSAGGVWSGSNANATVVGSTSLALTSSIVTGVSAGNDTIKYTLPTGCVATAPITVNAAPGAITGLPNVCIGLTSPLSDTSAGGTWGSSNYSSAFIDATGTVTGIAAGTDTITYTNSLGCIATKTIIVSPAPTAISGTPTICMGATAIFSDAVSGGVWSVGSTSLTMTSSGGSASPTAAIVTGVAAGVATITYSTGTGCTVTFPITVNAAPAGIHGTLQVCQGATTTFTDSTAGGHWSSVGAAGVLSISSSGVVSGGSAGTNTISYTLSTTGCAATAVVTVDPLPATILGTLHVCPLATTALTSGTGGVWSCTDGVPPAASIGSASGIVTGINAGVSLITYTLPTGCTRVATLTVNPSPAAIGGTASVCIGLTTTLSDTPPTGGFWSKGNSNININSASGLVTGIAIGTTPVTYTLPTTGCYAIKTVTVNTSPGSITGPTHVCPGATISLSNTIAGGTWSVGSTSLTMTGSASVTTTGVLTGINPGTVTVTYSLGAGCSASTVITVDPLPSVITGTTQVCVGATTALSDSIAGGTWSVSPGVGSTALTMTGSVATGISYGTAVVSYTAPAGCTRTTIVTVNPLPSPIAGPTAVCVGASIELVDGGGGTWSLAAGGAGSATVSSTGTVTGGSIGATIVDYTLPTGCSTTTTVNVSPAPGPISGASTVCAGATINLTNSVPGGVWTSSNISTAIIGSLSGIVTGLAPGSATTITYSLGASCTVTKVISVVASPLSISGGGSTCAGNTLSLADGTGSGTWSSGASGVATVSSTGVVHGLSGGTAPISYTIGTTGCSAITVVTVNPSPGVPIAIGSVCIGSTITATDTSVGGVWSSTSAGIAIVGSAGLTMTTAAVTGTAAGPAIITYSLGSCATTKTITVNPLPVISGATGLCTGTSTTLSGTGSGTWNTPAGGVVTIGTISGTVTAGTTSGAAIITFTSGTTGCATTTTVNVTTGPTLIGGTMHVCAGSTTNLSNGATGGTWSITPTTTATVNATSGTVTGLTSGVALVTYSLGTGCTVSAPLTVNPAPAVITGSLNVCAGATTPLDDITTGGLWTSIPTSVATVGPTGIVSGVSAGVALISYTYAGCAATKVVTVNPAPAAITGIASVCEGLTTTLTDTTAGGLWSVGGSTTLTMTGTAGLTLTTAVFTGSSTGTALISYTLPTGCMATKVVTVNAAPSAITGIMSICLGSSATLSDVTSGGAWISSAPLTASVNATTGVVSGLALGMAVVSYNSSSSTGCPAVATVTVNSLPGAISGSLKVCLGATDTLTDLPGGGLWNSSNVLVATFVADSAGLTVTGGTMTGGVMTGVAPGTASISYSLGVGCTVYATVTVQPAPPAISGPTYVCAGHTMILTDPATGGRWSSASTGIASIGSLTGVVSGITGGTTTISYIPASSPTGCPATYAVAVIQVPAIMGVSNICAYGSTISVSDSAAGGAWTSSLVGISPTGVVTSYAAGLATIFYTLSDGCMATATLTVNPLPAPIVGGTAHVCEGSTISLTDGTPGGAWSSGSSSIAIVGSTGVVTTISSGTSIIRYTLPSTGCAETVTVTVDTTPIAGTITGVDNVCVGSTVTLSTSAISGAWSASNTHASVDTGVLSGVSAGLDTVNYAVTNACGVATATRTVTINPLPNAGAISGTDSVCVGASVTLTESVAGGVWSVNNATASITAGLVSGTTVGRDTVVYSIINMCGIAKTDFAITVNTLPNEGTITGNTTVCLEYPDTLTGNPIGGVWSSSGANAVVGSTSLTMTTVVTGLNAGVDTIKYGFVNGCGAVVSDYLVWVEKCDSVTGVASPGLSKGEVTLWPNPAKNQLTVTNLAGNVLTIYDVLGQEVFRTSVVSDNQVLDISRVVPGVYVVQLRPSTTLGMIPSVVSSAASGMTMRLVIVK